MTCDRCGSGVEVRTLTGCAECGPIPLCPDCEYQHRREVVEDLLYQGLTTGRIELSGFTIDWTGQPT